MVEVIFDHKLKPKVHRKLRFNISTFIRAESKSIGVSLKAKSSTDTPMSINIAEPPRAFQIGLKTSAKTDMEIEMKEFLKDVCMVKVILSKSAASSFLQSFETQISSMGSEFESNFKFSHDFSLKTKRLVSLHLEKFACVDESEILIQQALAYIEKFGKFNKNMMRPCEWCRTFEIRELQKTNLSKEEIDAKLNDKKFSKRFHYRIGSHFICPRTMRGCDCHPEGENLFHLIFEELVEKDTHSPFKITMMNTYPEVDVKLMNSILEQIESKYGAWGATFYDLVKVFRSVNMPKEAIQAASTSLAIDINLNRVVHWKCLRDGRKYSFDSEKIFDTIWQEMSTDT